MGEPCAGGTRIFRVGEDSTLSLPADCSTIPPPADCRSVIIPSGDEDVVIDYEIQRTTRRCAASGREIAPGEDFHTVIRMVAGNVVREDYCQEAWQGPPADILGYWRSRLPEANASHRPTLIPPAEMLRLFEEIHQRGEALDLVYVLALMLVRRRVLKLDESIGSEAADEAVLHVLVPGGDQTYQVVVQEPTRARVQEIQEQLLRLLYSGGDRPLDPPT